MKKNIVLVFISFCVLPLFAQACDLAEFDWRNIHLYSCSSLQFKKTDINSFKKNQSSYKYNSKQEATTIYINNLKNSSNFSQIRAGFENNSLEWLDFEFKKPKDIEGVLYYFDNPISISKDFNKEYDYFNYDYFSLTVDKEHSKVYSINLFGYAGYKFDKTKINNILPDIKNLDTFSKLKPGVTTEKDFKMFFPFLKPHKTSRYSVNSNYVFNKKLLDSNKELNKAIYVFNNGLLSFISIYPYDINLDFIVENYGDPLKVETLSDKLTNCQYGNFSVIIDKNNKIQNIGIFSSI